MARIKNVELPKEKRTEIGLTYIYGIGRSTATKICADAKVDPSKRIKDLTPEDEAALRKEVDKYTRKIRLLESELKLFSYKKVKVETKGRSL